MTQHTPGTWTASGCDVGTLGPQGRVICWTGQPDIGLEEARANARLIAAAPDLLEALHGLVVDLSMSGDAWRWKGQLVAARAAIAKATGSD